MSIQNQQPLCQIAFFVIILHNKIVERFSTTFYNMEKALQQLGLNKKEVKVYLAGLQWGAQSASVIAKHTKIARPTIYDIFHSLIHKGLASKSNRGAITYFQVLDPQNLIRYIEREQQEKIRQLEKQKDSIKEILPELESLENPLSLRPKIKFFEGDAGMREAYEVSLQTSESIRAYANVEAMHQGLPTFFPEYYKRRVERGITIRGIFPDNEVSRERKKLDTKEHRESKLIDAKKYNFGPEVNIYDNKVLYASWREKTAILIESEEIADFHKKMYDLLWEKI